MKRILFLLGCCLFATASLSAWGKHKAKVRLEDYPNIVVFYVENLSWQSTSEPFWRDTTYWNRYYRTPNIERLADRGAKFTAAYSSALLTPSIISLETGMNPARHRVTNALPGTDLDNVYAPEHELLAWPDWNAAGLASGPGVEQMHATTLTEIVKERGYRLGLLDKRNPGYSVYFERELDTVVKTNTPIFLTVTFFIESEKDLVQMDRCLGDAMDLLEEYEVDDRTIMILVSMAGPIMPGSGTDEPVMPINYPLRGSPGEPFEGAIRMPMIISWPGVADTARAVHSPVVIHDLMPTIMDMAGVKRHKTVQKVDGLSLLPLLQGAKRMKHFDPLIWHYPHGGVRQGDGLRPYSMVRLGPWKLIYYYDNEQVMLFNLREDVSEKIDHGENLSEQRRRERMLQRLTRQLKSMDAQLPYLKIQARYCNYPDGTPYREKK